MTFGINGVDVGGSRSYVIAEVGHNHQGSFDTALELVKQAAWAGADAVKTQIRTNRDLYTKAYYDRPYDSENAYGPTYGAHREYLELSAEQHAKLRDYAQTLGLAYFATAFDFKALDLCIELGLPAVKLASGAITNTPLLMKAARSGVPIILSTGASHLEDVKRAVNCVSPFTRDIGLLQCTATYPSNWDELDLAVINTYRFLFPQCVPGLSSHTAGIADGPPAYVLGARIFEKHFTLNRSMKGTDHAFSLEPAGMRKFVRDLRRTEAMVGDGIKRFHLGEADARTKMGYSVYFTTNLRAGRVIEPGDVCIKSPAAFVPPHELTKVIGSELITDVKAEQAVSWEVMSEHVETGRAV